MVKHIILWTLKEQANTLEVKQAIKQNLEGLMGQIPGLIEIKVYTDPLKSSNADLCLYSCFEDEQALKGYATHPKHVAVADTYVRPYTATRSCMDFCEE